MSITIKGDKELIARLKRAGASLLPEIAPDVANQAARVMVSASAGIPRDSGDLASSQFVDGAEVNTSKLSVTATAGYTAPHAAFVHEGFHFGKKKKVAPKWLERAADDVAQGFASAISAAITAGLSRLGK